MITCPCVNFGKIQMRPYHKQTLAFYPAYQTTIEVDAGIAPLLLALWDEEIYTCNSCEENEPGLIWIELHSSRDAEKLLLTLVKALGDQIHNNPEANDWFFYRILGQNGDVLKPWRYDAHPNVCPGTKQEINHSENIEVSKIELSVSLRFPKEDYGTVMSLLPHRHKIPDNLSPPAKHENN